MKVVDIYLAASVNIHHYSPPLRWIIVNYSDTDRAWLLAYFLILYIQLLNHGMETNYKQNWKQDLII